MVTCDVSGAIKKTATLLRTAEASRWQVTRWASETVRDLQMSAHAQQKSWQVGSKVGQMARNVSFIMTGTPDMWTIQVGTGLKGQMTTIYADIQDRGGITHPLVTDRMRRWAWFMAYSGSRMQAEKKFAATFKRAGSGLRKVAGQQAHERFFGMYRGIALTHKDRLTVHVPASHWFSSVIERRVPVLSEMMSPEVIWNIAEQKTGL